MFLKVCISRQNSVNFCEKCSPDIKNVSSWPSYGHVTYEAHDHGSLKVGTWSKSVTTGISSWWSESTGLKANTLILISHILYTWLNVQSSIK